MDKVKPIFAFHGLKPVVNEDQPTHEAGNTLDQIFTNLDIAHSQVIEDRSGISDHYIISAKLLIIAGSKMSKRHTSDPYWMEADARRA